MPSRSGLRYSIFRANALIGLVSVVLLCACSKTPNSQPPTAPTPRTGVTNAPAWAGKTLHGNDPAALRSYIQNLPEIAPTKFKLVWSPDTVAFDRDATLRSLRSVSRDGAVFEIDSSEPAVAKLKPGSILWIWDIAVRRVQSLQIVGRVTVVKTVPVALNQAIPNADIEFEAPLNLSAYFPARRATPTAPKSTGLHHRLAPGFLYVSDSATQPEQPESSDPGSEQADDDWYETGMTANGYTGEKNGWSYSVGYKTRDGGITLELQARKGSEGAEGGAESAVDDKELAEKYKEIKEEHAKTREEIDKVKEQLREEEKELKAVDSDYSEKMQALTAKKDQQKLQMEWDGKRGIEAKKLADSELILAASRKRLEAIETRKRALKAAATVAKQLWDIVSDNIDARIRARVDLDGFAVAQSMSFADSEVTSASTRFKNLNGKVHAQLIGRLGQPGTEEIKIPVMQLPIAFNVPIPVGGIPFVVQIGTDFTLTMSLAGQHATLSVDGETAFNGDSGFTYSKGNASYSNNFKGDDPTIADYKGFSLGVSAVVFGVQIPRVGFGLGAFGVSSVAYIDVVNVITMTNGAAVGGLGPPCKRITYNAVGHVGIETDVFPLPFAATEKVSEALSPKKVFFERKKELLDPPIKMCQIG